MPPDPDMTESADEDDKIDEDIDNAMKIWKLAGVALLTWASRWATTSNRISKRKKGFIDTDTDN